MTMEIFMWDVLPALLGVGLGVTVAYLPDIQRWWQKRGAR